MKRSTLNATGGERQRIIIVGGGIAGLAAAHRVVELNAGASQPVNLLLLEARNRLGGSIVTHQHEGFLIEGGPDSFITQKPWATALCKRIGVDDQLIPTNPSCRRTFIVRRGRMYPIPEGFLLLAPTRIWPFIVSRLFSWPGKVRMGMDYILPAKNHRTDGDESLGAFVRRRFGREALARVAQPLVGGIYTADPDKLSLRTTMPRFLEMESAHGSIIRAMRKERRELSKQQPDDSGARYSLFVSLAGGMSVLVDALTSRLPAGAARTNAPVSRIVRDGSRWRVILADDLNEPADGVILACPSYVSASLLRDVDGQLADDLSAIPFASSATMSMAFRRDQVTHSLDGFGFVVPVVEKRSIIAVTFNSVKFPGRAPQGHVLMRAFLGGALQPEIYDLDDNELRQRVLCDLRELIGITGEPKSVELFRWPLSMPQYPVGHLNHLRRIETRLVDLPPIALAGNAYSGVGIPDCIHSGETAAANLLSRLGNAQRKATGKQG